MELRQGPLRVPATPARTTGSPRRWSATRRPASCGRPRGPRRSPSRPAACRRAPAGSACSTGGRLTGEDAYAYSKFARVALGTNDIDFRARPHSAEEADFLAAHVVGKALERDLRRPRAGQRRAARRLRARGRVADRVPAAAQGRPQRPHPGRTRSRPFTSRGLQKMHGTLVRTAPGDEAAALEALAHDGEVALDGRRRDPGRRAARDRPRRAVRGRCAGRHDRRPARLGPAPGRRARRARGRLPAQPAARRPSGRRRRRPRRPRHRVGRRPSRTTAGPRRRRDPRGRRRRRAQGAGRRRRRPRRPARPAPLPPPRSRPPASWSASRSAPAPVTARADVVFPVAPVAEKAGMFVDWEGRVRPFEKVLRDSHALPDLRVLAGIADELGVRLGFRTVDAGARRDAASSAPGTAPAPPRPTVRRRRSPGRRTVDDAEPCWRRWKLLLDDGRMLDGERLPQGHRRARRSRWCRPRRWPRSASPPASTSTVTGDRGTVDAPGRASADLPDGVVWAPTTLRLGTPPGPAYGSPRRGPSTEVHA